MKKTNGDQFAITIPAMQRVATIAREVGKDEAYMVWSVAEHIAQEDGRACIEDSDVKRALFWLIDEMRRQSGTSRKAGA